MITIPTSVTEIGNGSFEDCIGLTEMIIPLNVINIGINSFRN